MLQAGHLQHLQFIQILNTQPVLLLQKPIGRMKYTRMVLCRTITFLFQVVLKTALFRLSAGYLNQRGIVINTGLERFNFRANSDFKRGRLKIGENLGLSYSQQDPLADNGGRSLLEHAIKMAPYLPVYNPNNPGGFQGPTSSVDGQDAENPVRIMELNSYSQNTQDILGNLYAELDLVKGLKFRTNLGLQDERIVSNLLYPSYNDDNLGGNTHWANFANIFKNRATYSAFLFTNNFTYNLTLAQTQF